MVVNNPKPVKSESKVRDCVPEGNYRLVGWDIDTTGRRLIDEICQIVTYTPEKQFSQYVMPYSDLNFQAQKRHNLCVVTRFLYRMLTDFKTYKIIKTKSEVSALIDFLTWLEENRGEETDGIILVCHESRKIAPAMLLVALHRYNLLDRFKAVVKGFANSFLLAEDKCADTVKSFSLRMLSRVFLDTDEFLGNAVNRAKLCYMVIQHLGQSERQDLDGSGDISMSEQRYTVEIIRPYAATVKAEEEELAELKLQLERSNTFRPVFKEFMYTISNRQQATKLRLLLVNNKLDCNCLKEEWDKSGRSGLEEFLKAKVPDANAEQLAELLDVLDSYYDPSKEVIKPKERAPKTPKGKKQERKRNNNSTTEKFDNVVNSSEPAEASANVVAPATESVIPAVVEVTN